MNDDKIKGKMKGMEGKVQEKAGEWPHSKEDQLRGMGKQVEGKFQKGLGDVEDAGKDAARKMEDAGRDMKNDRIRRKQGETESPNRGIESEKEEEAA